MHRLPSIAIIWRFRIAALLVWCYFITLFGSPLGMAYALLEPSFVSMLVAIILLIAFIICGISQWLAAMRAKCPLCMMPVLATKNCVKNRNARKFLGSYRLQVANSILFKNYFRCPFCGESTELLVRERNTQR